MAVAVVVVTGIAASVAEIDIWMVRRVKSVDVVQTVID